jgi:hypothetical protein
VVDEEMIMEHYWNDNDKGKPKYWRKHVPVSYFPPQILHRLTGDRIRPSALRASQLTYDIPRRNIKRRNEKNEC